MQITAPEYHLEVEIDCKECDLSADDRVKLQDAFDHVGRAVAEFPKSDLWLTIVYHPRSRTYHAQAKLKWPGKTIITGRKSAELVPAVRMCLENAVRRLGTPAGEADPAAIARAGAAADRAVDSVPPEPVNRRELDAAADDQDYPKFRRIVSVFDEWVGDRVGRWLQRYPEAERELGLTFEISDIVEEVFLPAFDSHHDKPEAISFHDWLDRWIDPAVKLVWRSPEERENIESVRTGM